MKLNKKILTIVLVILFLSLSVSCGFRVRSKNTLPAQFKTTYLSLERPDSPLSTQLSQTLKSMGVTLAHHQSEASFTIIVSDDQFIYTQPTIVNASLPTSINYAQNATVRIQNNQNKAIIATKIFKTTETLTLNPNQIYTSNSDSFMKQELNHEINLLIYYWLTSTTVKDALNNANHTTSTRHALKK